ncbi:MAG: sulfotransferase family 2 domain-containing protein [Pseudomonadota bacterium]
MRISTTHKFIALANPRCASTSVREMINRYCDFRSNINCDLKHHSSLRTVEAFLSERGFDLDDFFIFTTVRNPWDRAVSIYHYGLKNTKSAWHQPAAGAGTFKKFLYTDMMARHFRPTPPLTALPEGPYDVDTFMRDSKGNDRGRIFRLEELHMIESVLKQEAGIDVKLPHVNATDRTAYRDYYDDESQHQVAFLFEKDIKRFDYTF